MSSLLFLTSNFGTIFFSDFPLKKKQDTNGESIWNDKPEGTDAIWKQNSEVTAITMPIVYYAFSYIS